MQKLLSFITAAALIASCGNEPASYPKGHVMADTLKKSKGKTMYVSTMDDYYKDQVRAEKLKGNYEVYYTTDDSMKYVYLKHDNIIHKLNSVPLNEGSFYYLGIVIEDFENFFLFGHDQGNGAPYSIELIDKKTGKNILEREMIDIDGNYGMDYIVYHDGLNKNQQTQFIVYNVVSKKKEYYDLPDKVFTQTPAFNFFNMRIDTITIRKIKVNYEFADSTLTKTYARKH